MIFKKFCDVSYDIDKFNEYSNICIDCSKNDDSDLGSEIIFVFLPVTLIQNVCINIYNI